MLRKTLPFLFILLAVLVLVWSLPQCSRPPASPPPAQPAAPVSTADNATPAPQTPATPDEAPAPQSAGTNETTSNETRVEAPAPDDQPAPSPRETTTRDEITEPVASDEDDGASAAPPTTSRAEPERPDNTTEEPLDTKPVPSAAEQQPANTSDPAAVKTPTPAAAPANHSTIILDGLQFASDSDQLVEGSEKVLENVITSLKNNPEVRLEIAGYTDDRGDPLYNRILSRRRAETVMIYLVEHGIDARRLTAAGYGSDDPIADNATEEGRRKNRRVELHIR